VIVLGSKGKRYSARFRFQVALEVLKGDRDAVQIARAHDLHPTTVSRWKWGSSWRTARRCLARIRRCPLANHDIR